LPLSLLTSNYASPKLMTNEGKRNQEVRESREFWRRNESFRTCEWGAASRYPSERLHDGRPCSRSLVWRWEF
jgi:hypothetical protein